MSKAKLERRKRRRRLDAERARKEQEFADDFDDGDDDGDVDADERRGGITGALDSVKGFFENRWAGDPDVVQERKSLSGRTKQRPEPPPLPLALGSLLAMVFPATLVLNSLTVFGQYPLMAALGIIVGLGLACVAFFLFKRRYWAWVTTIVVLGLFTISFVIGAVVQGALGWLLGSVYTVAPILLLSVPGSRAALIRGGGDSAPASDGAIDPEVG